MKGSLGGGLLWWRPHCMVRMLNVVKCILLGCVNFINRSRGLLTFATEVVQGVDALVYPFDNFVLTTKTSIDNSRTGFAIVMKAGKGGGKGTTSRCLSKLTMAKS